jgi:hypothetical protein
VRGRRLVHWLLSLGLAVVAFAWTWQQLEEHGRESGGLRVPDALDRQPWDTLEARIRATWEPGDRIRDALLLIGGGLLLGGAWRAWRAEGLPPATLRRVARNLAIVGSACLLLGVVRWRTQPPELTCNAYVPSDLLHDGVPGRVHAIGMEQVLESIPPAGMLPLLAVGGVLLGLALLVGVPAWLYAPRAPRPSRDPASTP